MNELNRLTLFPMGYFDRHILHGGGAKLPTPNKIYPTHANDIKLGQKVKPTLNFEVSLLEPL